MVDIVGIGSDYDDLKKQYDFATKKIQFLRNSERTENLAPIERFQLKNQIEEAEEARSQLEKQLAALEEKTSEKVADNTKLPDLYRLLLRLGYRQQIRLFRQTLQDESMMAFLIHGYPDYGQSWLLNRTVVKFVPHFLTGKIIRVHVGRKVRQNDASALWREVAGRVGLRGKQYTPSEIAQQVGQCLTTQNVLLVFHEVETLPESTLKELIQDFWLPLVNAVAAQPIEQRKFKLVMFLIDYAGCVGEWEIPFAERRDERWQATIPLKSPMISEFSESDLMEWVEKEYDQLPAALTARVEDSIKEILDQTDNGIPELVLDIICNHCGYDWYEESKKWLNL